MLTALLLSLFAGSAVFVGGWLAAHEDIQPKWLEQELRHFVTAIGGGALLAAVALVLVPDGTRDMPLTLGLLFFLAGGVGAMFLDRMLARKNTPASQLAAMLMDFVPETIVIGAVIAEDYSKAILLAVIIFIQNLPESFTAYREMRAPGTVKPRTLLLWFLAISVSGPLYVFVGSSLFAGHDLWLKSLMLLCAGGILYLIFQDVAPQAKLKNFWLPPFGALIGFSVGIIGYQLTGG